MKLTNSETEKLVTILNYLIEKIGYEVDTDGFGYYEDGEIFSITGNDIETFEEGLEFLLSELMEKRGD